MPRLPPQRLSCWAGSRMGEGAGNAARPASNSGAGRGYSAARRPMAVCATAKGRPGLPTILRGLVLRAIRAPHQLVRRSGRHLKRRRPRSGCAGADTSLHEEICVKPISRSTGCGDRAPDTRSPSPYGSEVRVDRGKAEGPSGVACSPSQGAPSVRSRPLERSSFDRKLCWVPRS